MPNTSAKEPYKHYLQSEHWQEKRKETLDRCGYKCIACSSTVDLHVHHLRYMVGGVSVRYRERPEDLTVLCQKCHTALHKLAKIGTKKFERLNLELVAGRLDPRHPYPEQLKKPKKEKKRKKERGQRRREVKAQQQRKSVVIWDADKQRANQLAAERKSQIALANIELRKNKVRDPILGTWSSQPSTLPK
jgi:5-methylcytosine-specific restriction endonuclease McrA